MDKAWQAQLMECSSCPRLRLFFFLHNCPWTTMMLQEALMLFMGRVNNTSWRLAQKPKVYVMDFIFYLLIKRKYKLQSNPNFAKNIVFKCHSTTKHQKRSLVGCRERGETSFQQSSKLCRFPESPLQQIKSGIGGLHGQKKPNKK